MERIRAATGWPISAVLKRGLLLVQEQITQEAAAAPYDIYRDLDLGPGGYSLAPATAVKAAVGAAIGRKLRR